MAYDPPIHHRKSIRLKNYDYSQTGAYFVTICAHNRTPYFGEVKDGVMYLNRLGQLAETVWQGLPEKFAQIQLGEFVVMPNHVHGIIVINSDQKKDMKGVMNQGAMNRAPTHSSSMSKTKQPERFVGAKLIAPSPQPTCQTIISKPKNFVEAQLIVPSLGQLIRHFKAKSTFLMHRLMNSSIPIWQRNYYEHIIRSESSYEMIAEYIQTNPRRWMDDRYFVE